MWFRCALSGEWTEGGALAKKVAASGPYGPTEGSRFERHAAAYELLGDSVISFDGTGRITGWNSASERLYGLAAKSARGRAIVQVLECAPSNWSSRLADSDEWTGEVERTTASGRRLMEVRWSAQRDALGVLTEVIEVGRAIGELVELRKVGVENSHRFENLFQALAVGFFETDFTTVGSELKKLRSSGVSDLRAHLRANPQYARHLMDSENVLDVNAAAVSLFSAEAAADLCGRRSSRLWPDESLEDWVEAVVAVMEKKPQFVCETKLRTLDGNLVDVLFTVAWSPESAKRGVMIVGVIDLGDRNRAYAELQRSEEKYRNLFDAMSVGFLEFDFRAADRLLTEYRLEGVADLESHLLERPDAMADLLDAIRISAINDRALQIFGVRESERMPSGMRWLWPPDGYAIVARAAHGRYHGRSLPPTDTRLRRLDGREIDVSFTAWADGARGSDRPVLCGIIDISDRVQAEQRLALVRAEFAHASRVSTLGELAASVAHEISQPLSAIITNGEIAARSLGRDAPSLDSLRLLNEHSLNAAKRAAGIVARIRSMAAPMAGRRTSLSMLEVAEESLSFVRHDLKQARVRATVRSSGTAPLVHGDRVQLQQIIVNLILNAVHAMEHTPPERRTIQLEVSGRLDETVLAIEDMGHGLQPGDEDRVFESFYTTKTTGMGIGLAVCRSIADAHGGSIEAIALPEGARFELKLPVPHVTSQDGTSTS